MATLELWLDDYSDIYSDFDSRQYMKRRVSEDFVQELKMALSHKDEFISDLILQLPPDKRNDSQEHLIAESLKTFFKKCQGFYDLRFYKTQAVSWLLLIGGIIVMITGAVLTYQMENSMVCQVLRVVLEPAGWFFVWRGMEALFYDLKKIKTERQFYTELAALRWQFKTIGE